MPSRSRVLVYLPPDELEYLKEWAKEENRPTSNLAATIIIRAIEQKESPSKVESPTLGDSDGELALELWRELLETKRVTPPMASKIAAIMNRPLKEVKEILNEVLEEDVNCGC